MTRLAAAPLRALAALALLAAAAAGQARPGSIYDAAAGPIGLAANKTAFRRGDLITVQISESQDVKNEEKSNLEKETDLSYRLLDFDIAPEAFDTLPALAAASERSLEGTANYEKKGQFSATITVMVVDTLPNGNLVIAGRREIRIDQEVKTIEVTGVVRRYDIAPDNTVLSEKVANARVSYVGSGPLTNHTNRRGLSRWIGDALDWLWPF